jgi:murein L,D-transpeptidase YcbB/YkuD
MADFIYIFPRSFAPCVADCVARSLSHSWQTPFVADGVVGPLTWAALPSGAPMPRLQEGSSGEVVKSLQQVLTTGAPGVWTTLPCAIDGSFGAATKASVQAFQTWGGVTPDGIVGDQTWGVQLGAAGATLESEVGLQYAV